MAYTMRLHQSCSRYLSPSRLTGQQLAPASTSHSSGSVEHGRPTDRMPNPQICQCASQFPRYKSTSQVMNTKERGGYLDLTSVLRTIGSLNIELPKGFRWKEKKEQREPTAKTTDDMTKKTDNADSEVQMSGSDVVKDIMARRVSREQHDFAQAMVEQHKTIKTFYREEPNSEPSTSIEDSTIKSTATSQSAGAGAIEATTNIVKQITSYLPGFSASPQPTSPKRISRVDTVPRSVVDRKTRTLIKLLKVATSSASKLVRLEELCRHLVTHPEAKSLAVQERLIPCLLQLRSCKDICLREQAMEGLALIGYVAPVKARGIRILTLDGGGTRGLVAIEMLRRLEAACNQPVHKMFDYICGVSTGSLIGVLLGEFRLSLDETERLYKTFSTEIFNQSRLRGVTKLVTSQSYYDAQLWEKILQENVGLKTYQESTRTENTPKLAAISTLMNARNLKNFVFRNYTHPAGSQTMYPGSMKYAFWEAIRASSAAPTYYEEYKLNDWIHQDGGIISNNPTGIAIHEARLLWPTDSIQCVVSLGTGRYLPSNLPETMPTGGRNMVNKIIQSATDTEGIHAVLHDLLDPSAYFRFNPYMSEDYGLDEIRPDCWDRMTHDTQIYCRKNRNKIQKASEKLLLEKLLHQKAIDWVKLKYDKMV